MKDFKPQRFSISHLLVLSRPKEAGNEALKFGYNWIFLRKIPIILNSFLNGSWTQKHFLKDFKI